MIVQLTIIQQNDSHSHIEPHWEGFYGREIRYDMTGGFARIAQYVKQQREKNPNLLFIDNGDLFHGTGPALLSKGETLIPVVSNLGLDAWVPGNWDYAYGPKQLQNLANRLPFSTIACNVFDSVHGIPLFLPYIVKEMQGLKVGMIGLTFPYEDQTMPPSFSEGLSFTLGLEVLPKYIEHLRTKEKVDLVILIEHIGLPLSQKLATLVTGIDVILSGHSHDRIKRPMKINNTLIIQSGSHASFLGQLDLKISNGKIIDYTHQLIPLLTDQFEEDPLIKELVDQAIIPYQNLQENVVGKTTIPLHRMFLLETPMDHFITDAYMHHINADISFSHGWRYGVPVLPGSITMKDIWQIIPSNPELFTVEVEGRELMQILEKNLTSVYASDPFQQMGGYILRSTGLYIAFKPYNGEGNRIEYVEVNGEPLKLDKSYKIIGAGQQDFRELGSRRKFLGIKSHDAIVQYLKEIKEYKGRNSNYVTSI
ncbi:bifunctional metallophosphatase/5'-nucleotidase [Tepidibacillus decaturensis]|uniref:Bifunctional metallophosphatase/5'-nucleotidase n=1 Tax=Tepidibacillus decaturensis TaxID=1413211 RepID=A0A135L1Q2_9BACI|nr:bifunctional metallophosphatase/5'-nucleotidase [Tepidibacillus decaturensis]KXG42941.1 bifunctional metallophosphatase/5'-nucleotidase [Tepidibacillus decaturensis]